MTKQEISELKKLLTPRNCSITRICGCYVDGEKNKKAQLKQAFLALPEEEMFKYFEILRKTLSGTPGKNLLTLEFPLNVNAAMSGMGGSNPLVMDNIPANGSATLDSTPTDSDIVSGTAPTGSNASLDNPLADVGAGSNSPLAGSGAGPDNPLAGSGAGSDRPLAGNSSGSNRPLAGSDASPDNPGATPDTPQEFLLRLRDSKLKDDAILEEFYDRVIENYEYVGNYLILLVHDVYDVPGKTTDGIEMEDASDEIYEYILCCVCPVELSKPGLSYNPEENTFHNRIRDWVVNLPETGFLFPAFHDRSTDIHSVLYYSKNPEELREAFVEPLLGCPLPMSAGGQKETFQTIIEDTLGEDCGIEMVKNIHDKLNELAEEYKESPEPLALDKNEVKTILADSGVANERLAEFDKHYDEAAGEKTSLLMNNVMNIKTFEVKTPDIVIKVNPERTDLIATRNIDGRECLVIELDGSVEVNGISVRAAAGAPGPEGNDEE